MLLITAVGQCDTDRILSTHPPIAGISGELIAAVLAGLGGAMLEAGQRQLVPTSPHLRAHQRGVGMRAIQWLARRRDWLR